MKQELVKLFLPIIFLFVFIVTLIGAINLYKQIKKIK